MCKDDQRGTRSVDVGCRFRPLGRAAPSFCYCRQERCPSMRPGRSRHTQGCAMPIRDRFLVFVGEIVEKSRRTRKLISCRAICGALRGAWSAIRAESRRDLHFPSSYSRSLSRDEVRQKPAQRHQPTCAQVANHPRKLMKYNRTYAKSGWPFRKTCTDPTSRAVLTK